MAVIETPTDTGISVLMSIYAGTDAGEFTICLNSILSQQRLPDEILIVFDGPVKADVRQCAMDIRADNKVSCSILEFEQNRGLGPALADGLEACRFNLVARVDTDDVNVERRFALQYRAFIDNPGLSIVGGQMQECYRQNNKTNRSIRSVPITHNAILKTARFRNPFNHPTVMFRRDHVLACGNYQPMLWFEDYFLWTRLLNAGYQASNLDQILVQTDVNGEYFRRRGGMGYFKHEVALAAALRKMGFHNLLDSVVFMTMRFVFRIVPIRFRSWLYRRTLRRNNPTEK